MKICTIILLWLISKSIFSQSVLTSGGGFSRSQIGSITTSVGQVFSKQIFNDKNSLKEGVLQCNVLK
jgi:hypothetical protein